VAASGLAVMLVALPGCFPVNQKGVLVVGHDQQGTLVVGGAECDSEHVTQADSIWAWDPDARTDDGDLWGIERYLTGPNAVAYEPPPPPPAPDPSVLAGVAMVAVGDPDPPGATVILALEEPLPRSFFVEATLDEYSDPTIRPLPVEAAGELDSYQVAVGEGTVVFDLDAAGVVRVVEEHCADDGSDVVRTAVVTGLVAAGIVVVAFALAMVVAARQYRRAGARAAEAKAARQRAAEPPGS
jgi:hypothetical protein